MKTTKIILYSILFIFSLMAVSSGAHNPFTAKSENQYTDAPAFKSKLFVKIIAWQHQLKEKMSMLVREAKTTRSMKPIFFLVAAAFAYGFIHAAGPGHGKALAVTYVLSQRPSYVNGLVFGNCMVFFHGLSGIIFVLVVRLILHANIIKNLENVTRITQLISYSMISCFGVGLFLFGMYHLITQRNQNQRISQSHQNRQAVHPVISAVVVGGIPCPGVVMVMLFALSMDLIILGVVLGLAISMGMALTVSIVVMLAISGKSVSLAVASKNEDRMIRVENVMRIVGGLALTAIGSVFLAAII
jgi:ABC-type nickel/cobalt efflux system permease component RcnA